MPLGGTGSILGGLLASAVGAPPVAGSFFAAIGDVIAAWGLTNIVVRPGAMVAAGATVTGAGTIEVIGDEGELGLKLAQAIGATDDANVEKWTVVAKGLMAHLESFGSVNPASFAVSNPVTGGPLGGSGLLSFSSPSFVPPLAAQLDVTEPVSAAALAAFNAALLNHIQTNATVVSIALVTPFVPLTAPPGGGPISGSGSIT